MPTNLDITATEQGTIVVRAVFTDEDGDSVTPASNVLWTLTDTSGTVINSRQDEVESAAATVDIVLSGDDLAIQAGETAQYVERRILVETTYDSSLGSGLPLKKSGAFLVANLVAVT